MKTYYRLVKSGDHVSGVECFFLTGNSKEPTRRVAYLDVAGTSGTCKCGGAIFVLNRGVCDWSVCGKCCKDHSDKYISKTRVGSPGLIGGST